MASLFVASLFHAPRFPALKIDDRAYLRQDERNDQVGAAGTLVKTSFADSASATPLAEIPQQGRPGEMHCRPPLIFGFYVPWDEGSLASLKANSSHLTHVIAEWLILRDGDGDVDDRTEAPVVEWLREQKLTVLVQVTNYSDDHWQEKEIHRVLTQPGARRRLVNNIRASVRKAGLAGVNIDFEQVPIADRNGLTAFIHELHDALAPDRLILTQDLPTDDPHLPAYDMAALAKWNDYVIPMVYDEHFASGAPGPIASLPWVRNQVREVLATFPRGKTVLGLGNFGYDWTLGSTRAAAEVRFSDVLARANQYRGTIGRHDRSRNSFLRYTKAGNEHEVWFLDAVSALNSIQEAHRAGLAGVSFWRMGAEDPSLWSLFENKNWPADEFNAETLGLLRPVDGTRQYGRGEAIHVSQTRSSGWRRVWRDDGGINESFVHVPTGDVVEGISSAEEKLVAMTFDDGPDPRYTPRVLDILKTRKVPATFFVIGKPAADSPELLVRIQAEGHNIGSHTYSHVNELVTSEGDLGLELNMTQRIIEHAIGRSTVLFRSPYNADSDPRSTEAVQAVLRPQRLGYTTIGERVDPRDWEARTPAEIVNVVMQDKHLGNILLLHDGGGNREATIQALPEIIDRLRSQGYRFVSLEELMGRSQDELMPPLSPAEWAWATVEGGLLTLRGRVQSAVQYLFLAAIAFTLLRTLLYPALSLVQKRRAAKRVFDPDFKPPVSVIVAAHNEEPVIAKTVAAVLASDYPDFELIVVDDGSTDGTLEVLRREFSLHRAVRVLSQPNCGKAAALNRAIAESSHDIIVALDADTLLCSKAIGRLVRHFSDPRVAAVSGNVKVGNPKKWIARFQSIEYVCGFNLDRRALDLVNAVAVVPGAAGAWRKSAVLEAGGLSLDTVAEDTDLTLAIRRQGLLIRYDEHALAYTEVPETLSALARQRLRWTFGTLQSAWKHRDTTFRARYGTMGFVTLPLIWLQQIMLGSISPIAEVALALTCIGGNPRTALLYYAGFLALELLAGLSAYALEGENPKNLSLLLFQRMLYPRLMLYVVCKSVLFAVGGRAMVWGVHTRKATVRIAPRRYTKPALQKAG